MSFHVKEHKVPAQHIREHPDALAIDDLRPDSTLYLSVKQYIPKNNPDPQPGDLTILGFHANSFCKELYEPTWEHLLTSLSLTSKTRIRSIWVADIVSQGSSYLLNESKLACGVSWDDHARDVLHLVNHFRSEMPPPILGVGHSMGAVIMIKLATIHPRLFHSLAHLDPWVFTSQRTYVLNPAHMIRTIVARKDMFPDRVAPAAKLKNNPVFKNWDPACLEIYFSHLFRQTPTVLHPESTSTTPTPQFTLRTPKQMEAYTLFRPNPRALNTSADTCTRLDRLLMPDQNYEVPVLHPISRPSSLNAIKDLTHLRPRCLFLYGSESHFSQGKHAQTDRARNLEVTGRDWGGSGGVRLGCVAEDVTPGGHLFPFEKPRELGERLARWVVEEGEVWWKERKMVEDALWVKTNRKTVREKQEFEPEYLELIKVWDGKGWNLPEGGRSRPKPRL